MEQKTTGADVIREAYDLITGPRQHDYNHPMDDYRRTAQIFAAITGHNLTPEEAILFMVSMKLSRLHNEIRLGMDIPDNTRDAIGYLGCLNMVREARRGLSV